jgi:hypothetical protein
MKRYLITGFVIVCLCVVISTVFAQKQSYKGVQWEYGLYEVSNIQISRSTPTHSTYRWEASNTGLSSNTEKDVWKEAGLKMKENELVTLVEWFNFLASQGWELISVNYTDTGHPRSGDLDIDRIKNAKERYWFKRAKR